MFSSQMRWLLRVGRLLRREERLELGLHSFVLDLRELRGVGQVGLGELLEATGDEHARGPETLDGVAGAELRGALGQPLGQPEGVAGGQHIGQQLPDLADLVIGQLARYGVDQREGVVEPQRDQAAFQQVVQHLVVDAAGEVRRQEAQFGADARPVAEAEGLQEADVDGRAAVVLGGLLERAEDLVEVARELVVQQVLVLAQRLRVERGRRGRGLLGDERGGPGEGGERGAGGPEREAEVHGFLRLNKARGDQEPLSGMRSWKSGRPSAIRCAGLGAGVGFWSS